ncbi:MAG: 1-acyl-sn-glycerol-3-phosphate acyltransferase [Acidobacteriota bacterium]|nr:1-acyl-sn-glycerol-3-phosphate acyltransferase [Acidobacteriota bacterium]
MLRTIWTGFIAALVTIPLSLATLIVAAFKSNARLIEPIIRLWAGSILKAAGIRLSVEGTEVIDRKQRYILVANHSSYFDIPCVFVAIPQPIRFMAKISLFKIPIFGWAIARAGFIPIDRKNRRTAVKSFEKAVDRIRKGNTVVVFPEEGRSRERAMRPFQRGGFLLALRSGLPILPVAIVGTYDVYRADATRVTPGPVIVRVGTPIPTEGLTVRDKDRLLNESREQISRMLYGEQPPPSAGPHPAASAPPA